MDVRGLIFWVAVCACRFDVGGVPMTRFVYVLPAGRFRWEVRVGGRHDAWHPRTSLFYRLKRDALIAARAIAIVIGGEVQPHDRRGVIQDPDSYGPDSPRRRG